MCIRDRYQRRVHGKQKKQKILIFIQKIPKTQKMQDFNPEDRLNQMLQAIQRVAQEKEYQIRQAGKVVFNQEKSKIVSQGKERIDNDMKKKYEDHLMKQKIDKSTKINEARISKMNLRFDLLSKLQEELTKTLSEIMKDVKKYKHFLKLLIIESLIKLMEDEVELICLKEDKKLIQDIIPEAEKEFIELIKKECNGRVMKTKIILNQDKDLQEKEKESIGGIILTSYHGKIVCSNTLLNRIILTFQQSLPDIRSQLYLDDSKK
eukprot:TRINITY_DN145_c0_g1_i1.p1 TRINITY_DN145_c0_g1~~TRINITY_DN145_c0_g1_i1.p1  ORF type:complete len:263 (-),score=47.52 TRINITY_DN145_c0_g1_i1:73-861(-)